MLQAGNTGNQEEPLVDDIVVRTLTELVPGGVRRGELRRGNRTMRWVEAGSGHPTVVFDAGLAEPGSLAWAGVLPAVAAQTRVIAYDRAGIGSSDPVSPLTLDGEVADLTALVSEAGDGPSVLVGHSWGACWRNWSRSATRA
jgi:pimeloyl-ACP methyl ester carboxylesterase